MHVWSDTSSIVSFLAPHTTARCRFMLVLWALCGARREAFLAFLSVDERIRGLHIRMHHRLALSHYQVSYCQRSGTLTSLEALRHGPQYQLHAAPLPGCLDRQRHATLLSSNYPASSSCVQLCILLAGHTRHAYAPSRSLNRRLDVPYYPSIHLAERQQRASEQAAQLLSSSCFTSDTKRTRRRNKKQPSKLLKIRPVAPPQRMRGKQLSTRAARRA